MIALTNDSRSQKSPMLYDLNPGSSSGSSKARCVAAWPAASRLGQLPATGVPSDSKLADEHLRVVSTTRTPPHSRPKGEFDGKPTAADGKRRV